jgi:hypothetical protein
MDPGVYFELTPAVAASILGQQRIIYFFVLICFFQRVFILCLQLALPPSIEDRLLALEGDKDQLHLQVIIREQVPHLDQEAARCRSGSEKSRSNTLTSIDKDQLYSHANLRKQVTYNLFTKLQRLASFAGQYVRVSNTS